MRRVLLPCLAAAASLLGPARPTRAHEPPTPSPASAPVSAASPSPLIEIDVPGFQPAVVSVPLGVIAPRPVLVATHGAGGRPEGQCQMWRRIVGDRAFILCPRGFPINPFVPPAQTGYFYTDHHSLGREISRALEALSAKFKGLVDATSPAYSGFSQGAIMGALLLPNHPARFGRAALIEGGVGSFQEWTIAAAQHWKERGGERAILACGGLRCAEHARVTASYLRRGGLSPQVLYVEGAGHSYGGAIEARLRGSFEWLIEGDARWSAAPPAGR